MDIIKGVLTIALFIVFCVLFFPLVTTVVSLFFALVIAFPPFLLIIPIILLIFGSRDTDQ